VKSETFNVYDTLHCGINALGNLFAGLLPFTAYLALQMIGDELVHRSRPYLTNYFIFHGSVFGVRLAVRLASHPLSTVATNLQAGKYASIRECVTGIYRERGLCGFWDGWIFEVGSYPFEVVRVLTYSYLRRYQW